MPQTSGQRVASRIVEAELAKREWNITDLASKTGMDPGTIGDFLNGKRWPKIGNQGKFEKAFDWPPGTLGRLSRGEKVELGEPAPPRPDFVTDLSLVPEVDLWDEISRRRQQRGGSAYDRATATQDAAGEHDQDNGGRNE